MNSLQREQKDTVRTREHKGRAECHQRRMQRKRVVGSVLALADQRPNTQYFKEMVFFPCPGLHQMQQLKEKKKKCPCLNPLELALRLPSTHPPTGL